MSLAGSIVLAVLGVAGIFLAGRERTRLLGWCLGIAAQALWVVFALATGQYGFLLSAGAYGAVYGRNAALERRRRRAAAR